MKKKLVEIIERLQKKIDHGREVTEQLKAERLRKKKNKIKDMRPGARKAIVEGLMYKKSPMQVMREEWERRKQKME